jgi:hypothetical protein
LHPLTYLRAYGYYKTEKQKEREGMKRKKKKGNKTAHKNVSTGRNIFVCTFWFTKRAKNST